MMNQNLIQKKQPPGNALQLQLLISSDEIEARLKRVARQLEAEYHGQELTIVMIMKGSFVLIADLMRHLHLPVRLDFIHCLSYANGKKGELTVRGVDDLEIKGRQILVIDDIFDTGETLSEVISQTKKRHPASIRSLVLLSKDVPHHTDYRPDIALFDIEDRFVVGYGLDYKEYYRGLPDIYAVEM